MQCLTDVLFSLSGDTERYQQTQHLSGGLERNVPLAKEEAKGVQDEASEQAVGGSVAKVREP